MSRAEAEARKQALREAAAAKLVPPASEPYTPAPTVRPKERSQEEREAATSAALIRKTANLAAAMDELAEGRAHRRKPLHQRALDRPSRKKHG